MMKILITGGTGFIGSRLVKNLLDEGDDITIISRQSVEKVHHHCSSNVRVIPAVAALSPADTFDAVINLAGEGIMDKRWSSQRKQELVDSRVGLTAELIDWMKRVNQRPELFISGSAIGYYGAHQAAEKLDERGESGRDFAASLCLRWEQAARRAEALGIRVCIVRTGVVLHPQGGALKKMLPAFRAGLGGPVGSGQQVMSWIHMQDMLNLLLFLLKSPDASGVYNATAPNPVSNKVFAKALGAVLRRPAIIPAPTVALRFALGESSLLLTEGQAVYPVRLTDAGFIFAYPDINSALEDLLA